MAGRPQQTGGSSFRKLLLYITVTVVGIWIGLAHPQQQKEQHVVSFHQGKHLNNEVGTINNKISRRILEENLNEVKTQLESFENDTKEEDDEEKNETREEEEVEAGEEEEEEGENEDEEKEERLKLSTTVVFIVLILILLTIAFESVKEGLEEDSDRNLRPIIDKLFGEMTVLGFLSMSSFIVTKTGLFRVISNDIFGDGEELVEIFEVVHYSIFMVMVFFVLQVFVLLGEAMKLEKEWIFMNKQCSNNMTPTGRRGSDELADSSESSASTSAVSMKFMRQSEKIKKSKGSATNLRSLLPGIRDIEKEFHEDTELFLSLRREFLLDRSIDPPFLPAQDKLGNDFNFGRYLSQCLGNYLQHVVHLSHYTWIFFGFCTIVYYAYVISVNGDMIILSWSWAISAWAFYLFNLYFERHLLEVRKKFTTKGTKRTKRMKKKATNNLTSIPVNGKVINNKGEFVDCESSPLIRYEPISDNYNEGSGSRLPEWTEIDPVEHVKNRSLFAKFFFWGSTRMPNRQETMFWLEHHGPKLFHFILQVNLIFTGLYSSLQLLSYEPFMFEYYCLETKQWSLYIVYMVTAILPVFGLVLSKKHLVAVGVEVCSVGIYRQPQVIAKVLHFEKTVEVVRTFIIIYKLRRFAMVVSENKQNAHSHNNNNDNHHDNSERSSGSNRVHYSLAFDDYEIEQVGKTFDMFDIEGDGVIKYNEFKQLMETLGAHMDDETLSNMINALDDDKNGQIDREEFIQWYSEQMLEDHGELTFKEKAKFLFQLFDEENTGSVTLSQFKNKLDALNVGFTIDEIGDLLNCLDEDNNGTICQEEFTQLLKDYQPEEIKEWEEFKQEGLRNEWDDYRREVLLSQSG